MRPLSRVTTATLDVLEVLTRPEDELYGLKIAQAARRKMGTVYLILAGLEEAGWVESFWERDELGSRGPRRRFYRLTGLGLKSSHELLMAQRGAARPDNKRRQTRFRPAMLERLLGAPR